MRRFLKSIIGFAEAVTSPRRPLRSLRGRRTGTSPCMDSPVARRAFRRICFFYTTKTMLIAPVFNVLGDNAIFLIVRSKLSGLSVHILRFIELDRRKSL
jgi:hypothetical protein